MARKANTHAANSRAHSNERFGAGEVAGAGELDLPSNGSGRSKETRGMAPKEAYPSRKTPSAPGKVSRASNQEEDSE